MTYLESAFFIVVSS